MKKEEIRKEECYETENVNVRTEDANLIMWIRLGIKKAFIVGNLKKLIRLQKIRNNAFH